TTPSPTSRSALGTASSATPTALPPETAETAVTTEPTSPAPPTNTTTPRPARAVADGHPTPDAVSFWPDLPEGALIAVEMDSTAGILLNDIPESEREALAAALLDQSEADWLALAQRQLQLTNYRLNFRNYIYANKGQLPLPPRELWQLELTSQPRREQVDIHDYVLIDYRFTGTLLSDAESPAQSEPALATEGGVWNEPFILPLDPNLLFQRTGNACLNEAGFPPSSYDSENAWIFYDFDCTPDSTGAVGCHRTVRPSLSCRQALANRVGTTETAVRFERLPWDDDLADSVRMGELTTVDHPDLKVVGEDLNDHRLEYIYFAPNSCGVQEGCVSGSGWRRVLRFSATIHNVGGERLHIGPVVSQDLANNVFVYDSCHDHFHYEGFGDFYLGDADNAAKQAFCIESTNRFSNNEFSPLVHNYTCTFQGIEVGWVDEYGAGLDCQWVDVTDIIDSEAETATSTGSVQAVTLPLGLHVNADRFLCEGEPTTDEEGNRLWESTGRTTERGAPINRPACDFFPGWDENNIEERPVVIPPTGSFVTQPCLHGQIGPLRNCDFTELPFPIFIPEEVDEEVEEEEGEEETATSAGSVQAVVGFPCTPGQTVTLSCELPNTAPAQTLRICETSVGLRAGTACLLQNALANRLFTSEGGEVSFTCPLPRDENEPGGGYALYVSPLLGSEAIEPVSCTVVESE
ncbi:MAG: lysyl oxidase family protein, partial [Chloroflexota bacterium]